MESALSQVNGYMSKYIDLSSVGKFLSQHKIAVLASSSAVLYGVWFLKRPRNLPPGPYGYPLIGSLPVVLSGMSSNVCRLAQKYGDVLCLWLGEDNYLVVLNSYDAIKEAYISRGSDFVDRQHSKYRGATFEDTIMSAAYDESYKASRKIISQAMRTMIATQMDSLFEQEMTKVSEYVQRQSDHTAIVLRVPITRVFTNVICGLLFDKNYNHGDKDLDNLAADVNHWFGRFLGLFSLEFFPSYIRMFMNSQVAEMKAETDHLLGIIKDHICHHQSQDREVTAVIDAYLKAEERGMFTPESIAGTILVFLPDAIHIAGGMGQWVFVYLLNHPQYQDQIYKEIQQLKGDSPLSINDRPNMPITEAFIMEVFRHVTPAAFGVFNNPSKSTTFRGYNLPEYVRIVAHIQAVHNDPKYFPEPQMFKPERFIKGGKIHKIEAFMPFGIGRRMCIGEPIVRNEIFLFLTSMIQRYIISQSRDGLPSMEKDPNAMILKPQGFTVRLEKRD